MASRNKAFTLVELLAVIAIIGILAGFIYAAVGHAIERAKISKTESVIEGLTVALKNYERDLGSFETEVANYKIPTGLISGGTGGNDKRILIVQLLSGRKVKESAGAYVFEVIRNIREDPKWNGPYLDPKVGELLPKSDTYTYGQLVDAWRNPLMIRIKKGNYDEMMRYRPDSFEIYSWGPNEKDDQGKSDDITNWD